MIERNIYKEFKRLGKLLFQQHLVSLTAGNISIRKDNNIYITASGSMLGDLKFDDIVRVPFNRDVEPDPILHKKASVEIIVHKSIYENTAHKAVVHVHAPTTIALSFNKDRIVPADSEGKFYIPEVPVVSVNGGIGSLKVAEEIPAILNKYPAVIIRGHGIFAVGDTLRNACGIASTIEFSSQILHLSLE